MSMVLENKYIFFETEELSKTWLTLFGYVNVRDYSQISFKIDSFE